MSVKLALWLPALLAASISSACVVGEPGDVGDQEPLTPGTELSGNDPSVAVGDLARVCNATALNMRSGPGTTNAILKVIPEGSTTKVVGISGSWVQNEWAGTTGWSSGAFLCPITTGGTQPPASTGAGGGFASTTISRDNFLSIGAASVGFSYYWGGGRLADGAAKGSCYGSCPSCTHSGSYGADCSGFVGKVWLLPESLPFGTNAHPYSTASFAGSSSLWSPVARTAMKPGDALVYRSSSAGHVLVYERDDPWGSFWSYEARGCSYGIVNNIRTAGSAYKAIRRTGVQ